MGTPVYIEVPLEVCSWKSIPCFNSFWMAIVSPKPDDCANCCCRVPKIEDRHCSETIVRKFEVYHCKHIHTLHDRCKGKLQSVMLPRASENSEQTCVQVRFFTARTPATDETASSSTFAWFGGPERNNVSSVCANLAYRLHEVIDGSQDHEPYRDIAQLLAIGLETIKNT